MLESIFALMRRWKLMKSGRHGTKPTTHKPRPSSTVAISLLAIGSITSACGASTPHATSATSAAKISKTISSATTKTQAQASEVVALTLAMKMADSPEIALRVSGAQTHPGVTGTSRLTMTVTSPIAETLPIIGIGSTEFITVPSSLAALVPTGVKWVSVNYTGLLQSIAASNNPAEFAVGIATDPASFLQLIAHSKLSDFAGGSSATINGAPATEFSASIAADGTPRELASGGSFGALIDSPHATLHLWVDSAGLIREITLSGPLAIKGASSASPSVAIKVTFSSFGGAVPVVSPAAKITMAQSPATIASVLASALG